MAQPQPPAPPAAEVGQRRSYGGAGCTVRYVGPVRGTPGPWLGVEWDDATRGRHDGTHAGVRYFSCLSRSPTAASFVRPTRPADRPQSFLAALREKYAPEAAGADAGGGDAEPHGQQQPIVVGGKVAQEMGFDRLRRRLARLADLRTVIVDGQRVAAAARPGEGRVADTCPAVAHLDLSRNLFERIGPVADVCAELPALRRLALNGNRFQGVMEDAALDDAALDDDDDDDAAAPFARVAELALGDTLLAWPEMCRIARRCPSLATLAAGANQLSALPPVRYGGLASTLTTVNLEHNDFRAVSDVASLAALPALRNLLLRGNAIAAMAAPATADAAADAAAAAPTFPPALQYLDLSSNSIGDWSFVDALASHFPGLTGLRIAHNPVYDGGDAGKAPSSEESHMYTIGRLARLGSLNFSHVRPQDRKNAELFYLSSIAKQLAAVPEAAEAAVLALHPRYAELCAIHGEPDVIRRGGIDPSFLEARLVTVRFHHPGSGKKTRRIPKAFDIYHVKGIAAKLFGLSPLSLRLIWETDEWDPAAGYDDGDDDDDDDDEDEEHGESSDEQGALPDPAAAPDGDDRYDKEPAEDPAGRWVRREVELKDSPKQLGYCVDGMDVRIRVEPA